MRFTDIVMFMISSLIVLACIGDTIVRSFISPISFVLLYLWWVIIVLYLITMEAFNGINSYKK